MHVERGRGGGGEEQDDKRRRREGKRGRVEERMRRWVGEGEESGGKVEGRMGEGESWMKWGEG